MLWLSIYVNGVFDGHWSGLWFHGYRFELPAAMEPRTYTKTRHGYDGQFYHMAAHDPWLLRGYSDYMDAPRYRRQRLLVPALSWAAGFGRDEWIDVAYIGWQIAFCAFGVWWISRLAVLAGRTPLWGLAFLILPGTVLSLNRMLVDGPFLALCFAVIYYDRQRFQVRLWVSLAALCLCREVGALVVAGICIPRLLNRDWRGIAIAMSSIAPLGAWYLWLAQRLPPAGGQLGQPQYIGLPPFAGLIGRIFQPLKYNSPPQPILAIFQAADVISLIGLGLAIVLAWIGFVRAPRWTAAAAAMVFATMAMFLSDPNMVWYDMYAYGRGLAPLLGFVDAMALDRRGWILFAPTVMQFPRLGLEFASPLLTVVRNLTS